MDSSTGPKLLQQAEKILLRPIHPHLISYCPTMDLIALVTDEETLDVYRINGQRAFGLKRKNTHSNIDAICWEFNGQAIAVAWSDGLTDILSAETGKVIHPNIPAPTVGSGPGDADREVGLVCMGWGLNFIDVGAVKRRTGLKNKSNGNATIDFGDENTDDWDAFKDDTTIEDFLQRQPDLQALDVAPDLPDQLAMMDVESLLPKLPAIPLPPATPFRMPGQQVDTGAFSSQAQVDSLLHSHHGKDHNSVDMFIRCTNAGTVHPSIYDSLETVNIRLPPDWGIRQSRPLLHTSHPYSCSHGLLTEIQLQGQSKLALVPLTLSFIPSAGIYLHLISSKTSQLQNLLQYIQQCLQRIRTFFKHSQDLPSKFMMNISETLEEKGQGDLVQNLYHLACTGNCPALLREWLVDELQEAGHKRWDNTVVSSYTTVLQLIHENLLPALDRCSIVLSRLRGLAQYYDSGWIFNTPVSEFSATLELLKNLRLLAQTSLLYGNEEKRQFQSFSKWLRYEIDFEATEPDSQSRAEMESRDPGVDIGMVLGYIRFGLVTSDLAPYLRPEAQLSETQKGASAPSYDETRKAIDLLKEQASYKEEALCLEHVFTHFNTNCTKLFQQISSWQESNISMDCGVILEDNLPSTKEGEQLVIDLRMVFEVSAGFFASQGHTSVLGEYNDCIISSAMEANLSIESMNQILSELTLSEAAQSEMISMYVLYSSPGQKSELHAHRLTHTPTINDLPKSLQAYAATTLNFAGATIIDAKFADDKSLLVLLQMQNEDKTCLILSLPYTSASSSTPITYSTLPSTSYQNHLLPSGKPASPTSRQVVNVNTETIKKHTRHVFDRRFTPMKLIVNGRKGRRAVVVLGSDRKHYRVLDLDFKESKKNGGEPSEKGEGDGAPQNETSDSMGDESDEATDVEMAGA
jgi:anaphase-promoting complex subunit 4